MVGVLLPGGLVAIHILVDALSEAQDMPYTSYRHEACRIGLGTALAKDGQRVTGTARTIGAEVVAMREEEVSIVDAIPDVLCLTNGYLVTLQIAPSRVAPCRVIDIGVLEDTAILRDPCEVASAREVCLVAV